MNSYLGPAPLVSLFWNALRLHVATYRKVSAESEATRLCLAVAVLGGAATGLGRGLSLGLMPPVAVVLYVVITLFGVLLESAIVWLPARLALRQEARFGELLRPLAAATAPRAVYLLAGLDASLWWIEPLGSVWLLAAFIIGVEAGLRRGWIPAIAVALLVGLLRWAFFSVVLGT